MRIFFSILIFLVIQLNLFSQKNIIGTYYQGSQLASTFTLLELNKDSTFTYDFTSSWSGITYKGKWEYKNDTIKLIPYKLNKHNIKEYKFSKNISFFRKRASKKLKKGGILCKTKTIHDEYGKFIQEKPLYYRGPYLEWIPKN